MNHKWLNKNSNERLIVFFNGWAMDESVISHLTFDGYDVIMIYDYNSIDLEKDLIEEINAYKDITVIGWSMGVWAASYYIDKLINIKQSIAINGTSRPIDDDFGIPEKVYDQTLELMSEPVREKFFSRMFLSKDEYIQFRECAPKRSIENQIEELKNIKSTISSDGYIKRDKSFNCAIISCNDKIIPTKNQLNFWQSKTLIKELNSGHFPFFSLNNWEEIINYAAK